MEMVFIELQRWFQKHVHVKYSPFYEMLVSLHVLHEPKHHTHRLKWAKEVCDQLDRNLSKTLYKLGDLSNKWLNILDYLDMLEDKSKQPEEIIDGIRQLNDDKFARLLTGNNSERTLGLSLHTLKSELCEALYDYHQHIFARELYRIEPWLIRSIHEISDGLQIDGGATILSLHPRIGVSEHWIKFYKAETYQYLWKDLDSITLYPSTFVAPHLLVGLDAPHLSIAFHVEIPGNEMKQEYVPEDLLTVLKLISDETRLLILQRLLYHSYCTQQLVDIFGLAPATISKHLKVLEKAKLIFSERRGHYVFYSTNKMQLSLLKVDLDQFFDQPLLSK
ncbi:metalloregulator ArsR/SmtB family transcription factor [Bacillus salitolerans]|uniref:Metalloregulator ArsR/SmtB family transcription factor n=1 Tax=Bacillus salitolerans TaxID=1437434 RepID=A0ABW4LQL2_9BACI